MRIVSVVGTRPQLIKAAALQPGAACPPRRGLRRHRPALGRGDGRSRSSPSSACRGPDHSLGVGGGSHAEQTARMLRGARADPRRRAAGRRARLRRHELDARRRPGGGQAGDPGGARGGRPAQLRPADAGGAQPRRRRPPRASWCFAPTPAAVANLAAEGIHEGRRPGRRPDAGPRRPGGRPRCGSRPSWRPIGERLGLALAPGALPVRHGPPGREPGAGGAARLGVDPRRCGPPRPAGRARPPPGDRCGAGGAGHRAPAWIRVVAPQGYRTTLALQLHAAAVLTDSGGVQREAAWLGTPCLVLRDRRPSGSRRSSGRSPEWCLWASTGSARPRSWPGLHQPQRRSSRRHGQHPWTFALPARPRPSARRSRREAGMAHRRVPSGKRQRGATREGRRLGAQRRHPRLSGPARGGEPGGGRPRGHGHGNLAARPRDHDRWNLAVPGRARRQPRGARRVHDHPRSHPDRRNLVDDVHPHAMAECAGGPGRDVGSACGSATAAGQGCAASPSGRDQRSLGRGAGGVGPRREQAARAARECRRARLHRLLAHGGHGLGPRRSRLGAACGRPPCPRLRGAADRVPGCRARWRASRLRQPRDLRDVGPGPGPATLAALGDAALGASARATCGRGGDCQPVARRRPQGPAGRATDRGRAQRPRALDAT